MLTSAHTQTQSSAPSKLLHENPSESKTPETELNHNENVQLEVTGRAIKINESSEIIHEECDSFEQGLSTRAMRMKEAINKKETVKVQTV